MGSHGTVYMEYGDGLLKTGAEYNAARRTYKRPASAARDVIKHVFHINFYRQKLTTSTNHFWNCDIMNWFSLQNYIDERAIFSYNGITEKIYRCVCVWPWQRPNVLSFLCGKFGTSSYIGKIAFLNHFKMAAILSI